MNPFENLGNAQYISPYAGNNLKEMNEAMAGLQGSYDKSVAEMDDIDMYIATTATTVRDSDKERYQAEVLQAKQELEAIANSDPRSIIQAHKKIAHVAKNLAGNSNITHMQRVKALEDKEQEMMIAGRGNGFEYVETSPVDQNGNSIIQPSIDENGNHITFRGNFEKKGEWTTAQKDVLSDLRPERTDELLELYANHVAEHGSGDESIANFYTMQASNLGISADDLQSYIDGSVDVYIEPGNLDGHQQYKTYTREAWKDEKVKTEAQAQKVAKDRIKKELADRAGLKALFNETTYKFSPLSTGSSKNTEDPIYTPEKVQTVVYEDSSDFAEDREDVHTQILKHRDGYVEGENNHTWFRIDQAAIGAAAEDLAEARANGGEIKRSVPTYPEEDFGHAVAESFNTEFHDVTMSEDQILDEMATGVVKLYNKIKETPEDVLKLVNHLNKGMALPEKLEGSKYMTKDGKLTEEGENFMQYAGDYMDLVAEEAGRYRSGDGFTITLDKYTVDAAKDVKQQIISSAPDINWLKVDSEGTIVSSEGPTADNLDLATMEVNGHFDAGSPLVGVSGGNYAFTEGNKVTLYDKEQNGYTYYASQGIPADLTSPKKVMGTSLQKKAYMYEILSVERRGARSLLPVSLDDPNAPGLALDNGPNGFTLDGVNAGQALEAYYRKAFTLEAGDTPEGRAQAEARLNSMREANPSAFKTNSAEAVELLYSNLSQWYKMGMDEFSVEDNGLGTTSFNISKKPEKQYKTRPEKSNEFLATPYMKEDDSIWDMARATNPQVAEEVEESAITPVQGKGIDPQVSLVTPVAPTQETTQETNQDFSSLEGNLPSPVPGASIIQSKGIHDIAGSRGIKYENRGVDFKVDPGTPMQSVSSGTVSGVVNLGRGRRAVIVDHGSYRAVYGNLGQLNVTSGDKIKPGQSIGAVAESIGDNLIGDTTAHFEIMQITPKGEYVMLDPSKWFKK